MKIKPLSELIGAIKSRSSKLIHDSGLKNFEWQRSFYDHIIRSDKSLNKVRDYINFNSINWQLDIENKKYLNKISKGNRKDKIQRYYEQICN